MPKKYHGLKEVSEEASELRQRDRGQECAVTRIALRESPLPTTVDMRPGRAVPPSATRSDHDLHLSCLEAAVGGVVVNEDALRNSPVVGPWYTCRMREFRDFNFKLTVIEKLMYTDKTLTPAFSIDALLRERGIPDAQSYVWDNDLASTVLEESRQYFEALEISDELLASVESLLIDGGHQIYYECSPVWDGEDDLYDIHSLDDLALLPNLKLIEDPGTNMLAVPNRLEILATRGIEFGL
jgi:hypothetical protein